MKLKENDIIQVHGWIMLKGMEGKLKVEKVDQFSYWFTRPAGNKIVARHLISDVDRFFKFDEE
jgi:hypothetical protein